MTIMIRLLYRRINIMRSTMIRGYIVAVVVVVVVVTANAANTVVTDAVVAV